MTRKRVSSGAPWEATVGYSRAVRVGNTITVAGTTAPGADAYAQAKAALAIIEKALVDLGSGVSDVVRTRIFVVNMDDADAIGRAHGEAFSGIRPAATMVEVRRLISPEMLVEIEVDAKVSLPSSTVSRFLCASVAGSVVLTTLSGWVYALMNRSWHPHDSFSERFFDGINNWQGDVALATLAALIYPAFRVSEAPLARGFLFGLCVALFIRLPALLVDWRYPRLTMNASFDAVGMLPVIVVGVIISFVYAWPQWRGGGRARST